VSVMSAQSLVFDPANPEFTADPYPFYKQLRNHAPAYHDEATGLWLVTRYADVMRAMTECEIFSSARGNVIVDSPTRVGKTLGSLDPPRHDDLRRIVQRGLSTSRIDAMLPVVRDAVRTQWLKVSDKGSCDLINDISRPVLFSAIGRLLGLDAAASEQAAELTAGLFHQDDGPFGSILPPATFHDVAAFLTEQTRKRSDERGDDLLSALLDAQDGGAPMEEAEIVANISTVLMAGNASIGHFFPNIMHALWRHPEQRRLIQQDPSLVMSAIEESARWDTSTQCFARQIVQNVDVEGTTIPAGSRAVIFYASANRDERVISDPDTFDIRRSRVRHFGFGMGPHVCAGANAARSILRIMLQELLPSLGDYELDLPRAKRVTHIMVRGFSVLPISWQ
jgi:cytochrome P450